MELAIVILLFFCCLALEKKYRVKLYDSKKERVAVVGITFIVLAVWELLNRYIYQAWLYPGTGMVGLYIFGLPLEMYLFYLVAPYFSFIVYELIHKEVDKR